MNIIRAEAQELSEKLTQYRRWLHEHAEVGFDLSATAAFVKKQLESFGYEVVPCGKCGLTATVGNGRGKTILLRADMDALPIREEADVPYRCCSGNMHACGHDMHTAMLLGAANLLAKHQEQLCGTVKLMFQSAEEVLEGAKEMIEGGVLKNPDVDAAVMLHVMIANPLPVGTVIVSSPGVSAPAADFFTIRVRGQGCHGAAPQKGVDALTAAARILLALEDIPSREVSSTYETVLTVGSFHGGSAGNVIADSAQLDGTVRCFDMDTEAFIKKRIEDISCFIAAASRAEAQIAFTSGCPTLVNDSALSEQVTAILRDLFGSDSVVTTQDFAKDGKLPRGGGSEDFAYISQEVPALMIALPAGRPEDGYRYPLHHPKAQFDESALAVGAAALAQIALEYLKEKK